MEAATCGANTGHVSSDMVAKVHIRGYVCGDGGSGN